MLRCCKEMRSGELNIQREPSVGDVFEHVIIGGVHVRDGMTITHASDVELDHPDSGRPQKTHTPRKRAARVRRHRGAH
jgi:hypothetical protein